MTDVRTSRVRMYAVRFVAGLTEKIRCSEDPIVTGATVTFVMSGYTRYYPDRRVTYVLTSVLGWEEVND